MDRWREKLKGLCESRPGGMRGVSRRAGLGESYVRDIVNRSRVPTIEHFHTIAGEFGMTASSLLAYIFDEDERFLMRAPIVGIASDAETWEPVDRSEHASFDILERDLFAITVMGDRMAPVYRHGDQLWCQPHTGNNFDNLIGKDCVVETRDGKRFIKILQRGTVPGKYNLRSYNGTSRDIENVSIERVSPIVWVKRA